MADSNIILKIKSLFSGEGFDKAQSAIKEANTHMSKGVGEANKLAGALAGVDTSASATAKSATSLVTAFAQGGVQGAAFAAATMALNKYLQDCQKEIEAVKKETEEMDKKMASAFSDALNGRIKDSISSAKELGTAFEIVQKHAEAASKAFAGLEAAKDAAGVMQLQIEKFNATVNEADEVIRKRIEAEYDLKIAEERLANIEAQGADKVEIARQAYLSNQERVNTITKQIAELDERIAIEKENAHNIRQADEKKSDEILKAVTQLEDQRREFIQKRNEATAASTELEVKWQTVSQDNQNAIAAQTLQVKKTEAELVEYEKKAREAKLSLEGPDADSGSLDDLINKVDEVKGWIDEPSEEIQSEVERIKSSVQTNIEKDVEEIRKKKLSIDTPVTVNFGPDAPNVIPTPEEVKKAREAAENAPYKTAEEFVHKWGTRFQSYLLTLDEQGLKKTLATGKYDDMLEVLKTLSPEVQEIVVEKVVKGTMLKHEEWRDFFSNVENIRDVINAGRNNNETDGEEAPAEPEKREENDQESPYGTQTDYSTILGEIKSLLQQSLQLQ